jgi:hypothetical protein
MKIMMSKLDKLKMPEKKPMMSRDEMMAQEDSETPEEEAAESPEEQAQEDEMGTEKHAQSDELTMISDDDLMAEVKKRGLMSKMSPEEEQSEGEPADQMA